jgi:NADPH-dependent glutamate synthase beta subunit-like oxidoreductase
MKVGVVGSGPVGLYAAYRLVKEGHSVVLFERASAIAGNVRSWDFVKLFSTTELNVRADVRETLGAAGHDLPADSTFLSGGELVKSVLEPLSAWLAASGRCEVKTNCEVLGIGRGRFLKSDAIAAVGDKRRFGKAFRVLFRERSKNEEDVDTGCDVVVDASGTYDAATANRVGVGGMAAPGEGAAEAAGLLRRVIPDVKGADSSLVAGRRVGIIGTGYSAITCLRNLCDLAEKGGLSAPSEVFWLTRTSPHKPPYQILENDPLPQRSELAKFGNRIAQTSGDSRDWGAARFQYIPDMAVAAIQRAGEGLKVRLELGDDGKEERQLNMDVLFSLTGFQPDKALWSELQVHTCYASDGPMKLAQSLLAAKIAAEGDPAAAGDCLSQAAPGKDTLLNPEPNFYVLGMKSYGRNSTFLMRVGYEQVDLLMEHLGSGM